MSQACEIEDLRDINVSERDIKGYNFEVLVSKLLDKSGIDYSANPLNSIKVWKQYQGRGSDFKIPSLNIELEAKSGYAKIFKSWILRDWIPRFSYHNETRIVIVKPTLKLSNQCLELLFNYGINVIYPDSISYLLKRGNKVLELNCNKNTNACVEKQKQSGEIEGLELMSSKSSSTFRDKFRTKLGKISRFVSDTLNLLRSLWHDKCGSVTLADWIPIKLKTKNKTSRTRRQKIFSCPFRLVVVCSYYPQFYLCSLLLVYDCIQKLLRLGYNEEEIYRYVKSCLFKGMWQYKNAHLIKCRCKPISFIDNEIVDRRFRSTLSIFEPCRKYKCSTMISKRICPYLLAIKKTKIKPKQLNLSAFIGGMIDGN
jgi:hypothetical protein